jgi:hypothetical protein
VFHEVLPEEQDEPCGSLGPSRADGASATHFTLDQDLLMAESGLVAAAKKSQAFLPALSYRREIYLQHATFWSGRYWVRTRDLLLLLVREAYYVCCGSWLFRNYLQIG